MAQKSKAHVESDELSIDFSAIKTFFSKKNNLLDNSQIKRYIMILLVLIPLLLSIYIRTLPANLPITDNWAREGIYNNIRNNIANEISLTYPNLPVQALETEVNKQFNEIIKLQGPAIEDAIKNQGAFFKEKFQDENGITYLGDIDSYFWMRYARNLVEKGSYGDETRNGVQYDTRMSAPFGKNADVNLYPYIEAYLTKILTLFGLKSPLLQAAFYTPILLSFIAIIIAFLLGNKIGGIFSGFLASMLIAVNPTILSRSLGSDNDIVNIVFPLIIMFTVLLAFDAKSLKKLIVFSILSGLFIGFYSFAWTGWWFMFLFILVAVCIYLAYITLFHFFEDPKEWSKKLISSQKIKFTVIFVMLFLVTSFVSLSLFGNSNQFFKSFTNPFGIIKLKEAARGFSIWPNVYTTVAELNEANTPQIVGNLGGWIFFWIALLGTIVPLVNLKSNGKKLYNNLGYLGLSGLYLAMLSIFASTSSFNVTYLSILLLIPLFIGLFLSAKSGEQIQPKYAILTTIWLVATIYAATKGVRFILLIVPAFVISFSAFFGLTIDLLSTWGAKIFEIRSRVLKTIMILIMIVILFNPFYRGSELSRGVATAYNYVPSVNDGWVETLTKINLESSTDAIINSWWDFGHWFKFWADRKVTFDGASQNSQRAHWIGKVLLTNDEEQAIAILRMLDCGGDRLFSELRGILNDQYLTVQTVYDLLDMDEQNAKTYLLTIAGEEKTEQLISYLFCEPPENYFITSEDMVGKSGVWAHFGIWDFDRAMIYNYFKTQDLTKFTASLEALNYNKDEAVKIYYELLSLTSDRQLNDWIAPWPSYGGSVSCSSVTNVTLQCNVPLTNTQYIPLSINLSSMEAYAAINGQVYYPNKFGYFDGDEYTVKDYDENLIGYGIAMSENNRVIHFMSEQLVDSMFTRLFYFDGKSLTKFEKFHDVTDVTGARIITWKINWNT